MISYVTGTLGSGKSTYGARKAGRALLEGRAVATNMRFVDGWQEVVARRFPSYRLASAAKRQRLCEEIESRYLYEPDLSRLLATRLHGHGEARGLMVVDESHNELNNRTWENEEQREALRRATLLRKRGWEALFLSQHKDNTDAAVRRIAAVEIRVINWRQLTRVPVLGTPLLPFPLFLALAYPTNVPAGIKDAKRVMWRELYTLGWTRRLFDTFEDFGSIAEDVEGALWLPAAPQDRARADAAAAAVAARALGSGSGNGHRPVQSAVTRPRAGGARSAARGPSRSSMGGEGEAGS